MNQPNIPGLALSLENTKELRTYATALKQGKIPTDPLSKAEWSASRAGEKIVYELIEGFHTSMTIVSNRKRVGMNNYGYEAIHDRTGTRFSILENHIVNWQD